MRAEPPAPGPLDGVRVLDLTTVLLGPWATQTLGDLGADVIKIETPNGDLMRQLGPRRNLNMSSVFLGSNRNKRSLVLDLKQAEGREALLRLAGDAAVMLHNMRPKAAEKLRIDYESIRAVNPAIVYGAAYGYKQGGPYADKPAYDDIIQAACGLADLQKDLTGEPRYVPSVVADKTTAMQLVCAITAGLFYRERCGRGQLIEVPMFETLVSYIMVEHLYGQSFEPPLGSTGYPRTLAPQRRPYATRDGYLAVMPYTDEHWRALLACAERQDLAGDGRFATAAARLENIGFVYQTLGEIIRSKTSDEWKQRLEEANVPVMAVNSTESLLEDPQLEATGFWKMQSHPTEGKLRMPAPSMEFSHSPAAIRRHPPNLGEHSSEVLKEAGYSPNEINRLAQAGVTLLHERSE